MNKPKNTLTHKKEKQTKNKIKANTPPQKEQKHPPQKKNQKQNKTPHLFLNGSFPTESDVNTLCFFFQRFDLFEFFLYIGQVISK